MSVRVCVDRVEMLSEKKMMADERIGERKCVGGRQRRGTNRDQNQSTFFDSPQYFVRVLKVHSGTFHYEIIPTSHTNVSKGS
jgi:hypothetical protein